MSKFVNRSRRRALRSCFKNAEGSVALTFALAFLPAMVMIGVTMDYANHSRNRSNLQQALDSALLAAGSKMTSTTTVADATSRIQNFLNAANGMGSAQASNVTISADKTTLCSDATLTVPSSFMQIVGIANTKPSATACVSLAGSVDPNMTFEIALVLDNSGSMSESAGGQSKISALKSAATSFVNTVFTTAPNKVQFSITPFATSVVAVDPILTTSRTATWIDLLGVSSQHWIAFDSSTDPTIRKTHVTAAGFTNRFDIYTKLVAQNSSWDWGGCFEPQPYPKNVNDTPPSALDPDSLFVPFLAPDEPDSGGNYGNDYLSDSGGSCSGTVTGEWANLTNVCKYGTHISSGHGGHGGHGGGGGGGHNGNGPNNTCPDSSTQTLLQLTSTKATITNKLNSLVASGTTNLHEGFMWGWRTISPNAPFSAGRAYNTSNNRKIMVFMTDGFNNWQSAGGTVGGSQYEAAGYYSYNGAANIRMPNGAAGDHVNYQTTMAAASSNSNDFHGTSRKAQDDLTLEACTNAKAQGIEIFTIGFSIPSDPIDQEGLALLQNCATDASHYFAVADASQLNTAFSQIGIGVGKLRLSK